MKPPAIAEAVAGAERRGWREAVRNRNVQMGLVLVGLLALVAVFAPILSRHDPDQLFADGLDEKGMPVAPSGRFWLGTDSLGRDIFSRALYGSRISLLVGVVAVLTATGIGIGVGLVAGYSWRWVDMILMRCTDIMMALPAVLLAIALAGIIAANKDDSPVAPEQSASPETETAEQPPAVQPWFKIKQGLLTLSLVIAVVSWTGMARVVRAQVLTLKERDFVLAARAIGCSPTRILWRHIFPNVLPTIIVLATLSTASTIGLEAGLSYLGIGIPPPTPSWGSMVSDGQAYMIAAPWMALPPGIAIVLAVLGFNLLGQGLQDVLDPYQKRSA
jgi:peptide/nickel transport system permease protein